jgi:hypothetical protein
MMCIISVLAEENGCNETLCAIGFIILVVLTKSRIGQDMGHFPQSADQMEIVQHKNPLCQMIGVQSRWHTGASVMRSILDNRM